MTLKSILLLLALTTAVFIPITTAHAQTSDVHIVQPSETVGQIAAQYGVSMTALTALNNLPNPNLIFVGQRLMIPTSALHPPITHQILSGQTLFIIANMYGTTVADLMTLNEIVNPAYIQAGQTLLVSSGETAVVPSPVTAVRRMVVDLSDQHAYVYANGALQYAFVISTGQYGSETAVGSYNIQNKIPNAYAYTWSLDMPYWMGIYYAGGLQNGFHALPIMADGSQLWRGYLGTPISYGCIVLSPEDAATLYNWTEIGDEVVIQP